MTIPSVLYVTEDGIRLGQWINNQRGFYHRGILSSERIALLEAIPGWVWNVFDSQFEKGCETLQQYVEREGDALVPASYVTEDGVKLGSWVSGQRDDYQKGILSPERIALLEVIPGWTWKPRDEQFEKGFVILQKYVQREGHAIASRKTYVVDGFKLGQWVSNQRAFYRRGILSSDRIERLESIPGWVWNVLDSQFERGFAALKQYAAEFGTARVPPSYVTEDGFRLGGWVNKQRSHYGKIIPERIALLEAIPAWTWGVRDSVFEVNCMALKQYVEREGDALVPASYVTEDGIHLGGWVNKQRTAYQKGERKISPERIARLEAISGWVWNTGRYRKKTAT
jgi:Helicase associated domain